jgi:hypothetical protein
VVSTVNSWLAGFAIWVIAVGVAVVVFDVRRILRTAPVQ